MKRHLLALFVRVLFCLTVLPSTASTDSGPKPAVTIAVVNALAGEHYLDLLIIDPDGHTNIDPANYDPNLPQGLRDWEIDSWHLALAEGTSVPLSGDLRPGEDDTHRFTHYGLPRAFRTAVLGPDGAWATDEPFARTVFYTHLTYGWETNSIIRDASPAGFYGAQSLPTLVPILIIEDVLLRLSGLRACRDWLVFLVINLATQAGLHLWIVADLISIGDSALQYLVLLVTGVPILLAKLITYVFLPKEYSGLRRAAHVVCANIASYAVGYLPLHWVVELLAR